MTRNRSKYKPCNSILQIYFIDELYRAREILTKPKFHGNQWSGEKSSDQTWTSYCNDIGHSATSNWLDKATLKQQFISESGFSEGFIKLMASLSDFYLQFESYKENCHDKKTWPGIKEFVEIINKLNKPIKDVFNSQGNIQLCVRNRRNYLG